MLKILFINEYFPPYAPGGGEWSTYYLANDLAKNNFANVVVLTPNYGKETIKLDKNITIERIPFYGKLSNTKNIFSSVYHNNPLWFLWEAFFIFMIAKKYQSELLHVHGKYSIPAARIANFFLNKPLLVTIRDYQIVCNYGFCLYQRNRACNLVEYFKNDFVTYCRLFVTPRNLFTISINFGFACWGRISRNILKSFATDLETIVLSQSQKRIFTKAGFKQVQVIQNSIDFLKKPKLTKRGKIILFAGRLTYGKGVGLITNIIPKFFKTFPDYSLYFVGDGPYKYELINLSKKYSGIKVLGNLDHQKLMKLYSRAVLSIVPSLWPEPFGRIALESLSCLTPVIVTDKGGLPEIVENNRWGYVVAASEASFFQGIKKGIKNNRQLLKNVNFDYEIIKKKFGQDISAVYLKHYQRLLRTS